MIEVFGLVMGAIVHAYVSHSCKKARQLALYVCIRCCDAWLAPLNAVIALCVTCQTLSHDLLLLQPRGTDGERQELARSGAAPPEEAPAAA